MTPRLGAVVEVGGDVPLRAQLVGRASPSGWWALPTAGGRAVRVLFSRGVARLAAESREPVSR